MKKFKCVTDMIEHIVSETKAADCTHFHHDALSLMTATSTIDWMKNKGYLDMWIRPAHGIIDEFKQFKGSPPGNRPEWMPMDSSLNKDVHEGVLEHIAYTRSYDDDDRESFGPTPRGA